MVTPTLAQQKAFFETFGYLKLPGLVLPEIEKITSEFEAVFPQMGRSHDGSVRTAINHFVDQRADLCALLDHPGLLGAIGNLLGDDFNYMGSDGNYFTGETTWHRDSEMPGNAFAKVAFYLDPVARDTGCLRVMPGSHLEGSLVEWREETFRDSDDQWGLSQRDLPAVALESQPGDVLVFNHRLMHASFGGSTARRMFTFNLSRRAQTRTELNDLISYGDTHGCGFGQTKPYDTLMLETASPARQEHLEQYQKYWSSSVARHQARTAGT
ncbi:phytanoyl-CoA dioxygenase family protein [Opitutaceae bacterium]|nr:phytanoyl-CoA dioxygenase family protein [Opitutaceae bacterium]